MFLEVFHKVNENENSSQYCTYKGFAKFEIKRFVCVNTKMHLSDVVMVVCRHLQKTFTGFAALHHCVKK